MSLTSARDITRAAWPPRAAFLDYPLGHTAGRRHQGDLNRSIMLDVLAAIEDIDEPGAIIDLPYHWDDMDDWKDGVMRPEEGEKTWTDNRVERFPEPQYQSADDADAAEAAHAGLSCAVCVGVDF